MSEKVTAYIALGSNIAPREGHLSAAIEKLASHPQIEIVKQSAIYETVPKGFANQEDFLNMVIAVATSLPVEELLDLCQAIELDLKRVRTIKNGPRTIDLDILMYGDTVVETKRLILPHPRLHERAFVLFPFAEVAADLVVPRLVGGTSTVTELRDALPEAEKADVRQYPC